MSMLRLLSVCTLIVPVLSFADCKQALDQQYQPIRAKIHQADPRVSAAFRQVVAQCPDFAALQAEYAGYLGQLGETVESQKFYGIAYDTSLRMEKYSQAADIALYLLKSSIERKDRLSGYGYEQDLRLLINQARWTPSPAQHSTLAQLSQQLQDLLAAQPFDGAELMQLVAQQNSRDIGVEGVDAAPPEISYQIPFDSNADRPNADGIAMLSQIGQSLSALGSKKIEVVGHTDQVGDAKYNQRLSLRRAQSVMRVLIQEYPSLSGQLSATGKGETQLLSQGMSEEDHRLNRRVSFVIR